jgi:protein gp37
MSDRSAIEWTEATWNPVTGCTKVSPGCAHCYAETFAERFRGVSGHPYEQGFDLRTWSERLELPLRWHRPRRVFVNSMSDLFHDEVPDMFVRQVFAVMERADWHTFQVLTKRSERLREIAPSLPWPPNVWMGVSIENRRFVHRADHLRQVPAAVRFISAEPLLGPLDGLMLEAIDWLIVGGESGPRARPMHPTWARRLRDQCREASIAFFFKQWGAHAPEDHLKGSTHGSLTLVDVRGPQRSETHRDSPQDPDWAHLRRVGKRDAGRLLDGREWSQMPHPRRCTALPRCAKARES